MSTSLEILNGLIVGRVTPHIYAFSTTKVPGYWKVGDTYRSVSVRIAEWKKRFTDLNLEFQASASINENVFFRDYAVHKYLEHHGKSRLAINKIDQSYYSNEFFKGTKQIDIMNAIDDIKAQFVNHQSTYQYYNAQTSLPQSTIYTSTGWWHPRPNQKETIDKFKIAVDAKRKNLLMFAVMRFGKSFTSLCCANVIDAKIVLIVSAKADVREEWKKTVQQADNFNTRYDFLTKDELASDDQTIEKKLQSGKGTVIFLTLQDLQGDEIKQKHKQVFDQSIDLLIIDETHYGARAEKYGQVLKNRSLREKHKHDDDDYVDYQSSDLQEVKNLKAKIKLHLSGTPYRILMESEFEKEDIIAFYQFSNIVDDQKKWDEDNLFLDDINEWDNPYYGFPQMIRFAFNLSKKAKDKLEALKKSGNTYAFSSLFEPKSIKKEANGSHKFFIYEDEILDLFKVIDGSQYDETLLSFLNYDKIKEGHMCRHIVCVLPYCASCDALENLLITHQSSFENLKDYTIINISGVDQIDLYPDVNSVKQKIAQCEKDGKKTITLTVNRMLTGSTVEQWDTMLFLKDTASPQEYDQAIFRLQNQYIKEFVNQDGKKIKVNMKPQTLLVDFAPERMFRMQGQKSLIYNVNTDEGGNDKLIERIEKELQISPIITMNFPIITNHLNQIQQVQATDILKVISDYSNKRGILEETLDIPIDMSLLDDPYIKNAINQQAEIGSNIGFNIPVYQETGEGTDLSGIPTPPPSTQVGPKPTPNDNQSDPKESSDQTLANKFRTYYSRLLFYAFLCPVQLKSLEDIIQSFQNEENRQIAKHLHLYSNQKADQVLVRVKEQMNIFALNQLDYKIQNINALAHDESIEPIERAIRAINKFGKLSESEVTTPLHIAKDMIDLLTDDSIHKLKEDHVAILDIASKIGEFAIVICERAKKLNIEINEIKSSILSIPTSSIAYQFTKKIYSVLGLDINCIAHPDNFDAYQLLEKNRSQDKSKVIDYAKISRLLKQRKSLSRIKLDDQIEEGEEMKFEAIVGNPPYQVSDGGHGASARPIYHTFVEVSIQLAPNYLTMIIPSRWFAGGKGLDQFRANMLKDRRMKILADSTNSNDCFPSVEIKGGVCYFLWDKNHNGTCKIYSMFDEKNSFSRFLDEYDVFVRFNEAMSILKKVRSLNEKTIDKQVSSSKPFGFRTFFDDFSESPIENSVKIYANKKQGYVERSKIIVNKQWVDKYKVLTTKGYGAGEGFPHQIIGVPILTEKNSCCTETYLVCGIYDTEDQAKNFETYMKTKFFRFLVALRKNTQDVTQDRFAFVPQLDMSKKWTDAELYEKYGLTQAEIAFIDSMIRPID